MLHYIYASCIFYMHDKLSICHGMMHDNFNCNFNNMRVMPWQF